MGSNLQVSANDNFMLCGGDSFQVLHITSEIELWLKIKCPQLAEKLLREGFQAVCSYLSDLINEVPVCYDVNHASSSYVNNPSHDELSSCDVSEHLITSRGHTLRMLTLTDIRCQNDIPNIKADIVWEYNTKKCVDASPLIINTPE